MVRDGRRLLLKGLPPDLRNHPEEVARLRKEYTIGLRLDHPGVVRFFGFETFPDTGPVIVMEYIDGLPLAEFIKGNLRKGGSHEERKAAIPDLTKRRKIAFQIAETLEYIHSCGFSHRDLKPDNILIASRGFRPKIIDFGLGDGEDYLMYKKSLATTQFGAPEQQEATVGDSRADVYSFGRILERLLPERRFGSLRKACMAENPEQRIEMSEVVRILDPTRSRKFRGWWWGVIFLVALILGIGGWLYLDSAPAPTAAIVEKDNDGSPLKEASVAHEEEVDARDRMDHKEEIRKESTVEPPEKSLSGAVPPQPEKSQEKSVEKDVGKADLTVWIAKFNKQTDEVFQKYGLPKQRPWITDVSDQEIPLRRWSECKAIARNAEEEMQGAGLSPQEIESVIKSYWEHYTLTLSRFTLPDS